MWLIMWQVGQQVPHAYFLAKKGIFSLTHGKHALLDSGKKKAARDVLPFLLMTLVFDNLAGCPVAS